MTQRKTKRQKTKRQQKPKRQLLYARRTAAERLDCSVSTIKRLQQAGKLTARRLGKRNVFYPASQVDALARGR